MWGNRADNISGQSIISCLFRWIGPTVRPIIGESGIDLLNCLKVLYGGKIPRLQILPGLPFQTLPMPGADNFSIRPPVCRRKHAINPRLQIIKTADAVIMPIGLKLMCQRDAVERFTRVINLDHGGINQSVGITPENIGTFR